MNIRNEALMTSTEKSKSYRNINSGKLSLKSCLSVGSKGPQKAETIATMGINDNRVDDDANYYHESTNKGHVTPSIYGCDTNNNRPSSTNSDQLEKLVY